MHCESRQQCLHVDYATAYRPVCMYLAHVVSECRASHLNRFEERCALEKEVISSRSFRLFYTQTVNQKAGGRTTNYRCCQAIQHPGVVYTLWAAFQTSGQFNRRKLGGHPRSTEAEDDKYIFLATKKEPKLQSWSNGNSILCSHRISDISEKCFKASATDGPVYPKTCCVS